MIIYDGLIWWFLLMRIYDNRPLSDGFPAIVRPNKNRMAIGFEEPKRPRRPRLPPHLWANSPGRPPGHPDNQAVEEEDILYIVYIYIMYIERMKKIYIYTVDTSLYDIIWYHSMSMSVYIYIVCLVQYTVLQSIAMQSNAKCKSKQFVNVMCIILYNANVMYCKVCIVSYRMVLYGTVWYGTGQNLGPIPRPQQMSSPACLHFLADATISGSTKGCIGRRCPTNINV